MPASIDLLHPKLRELFIRLQGKYVSEFPGREFVLTHTRRTPVEQLYLFVQGRLPNHPGPIVTWKDGFVNRSRHNFDPSEAFDFGIKINGQYEWRDSIMLPHLSAYIPTALALLGYGREIRYGGEFRDYYHIELRR